MFNKNNNNNNDIQERMKGEYYSFSLPYVRVFSLFSSFFIISVFLPPFRSMVIMMFEAFTLIIKYIL